MPDTPRPGLLDSDRITQMYVTLFGVSGSNGLQGECKDMRKRIAKLELAQARLAVIAGIGSGLVVTAGTYLLKLIGG